MLRQRREEKSWKKHWEMKAGSEGGGKRRECVDTRNRATEKKRKRRARPWAGDGKKQKFENRGGLKKEEGDPQRHNTRHSPFLSRKTLISSLTFASTCLVLSLLKRRSKRQNERAKRRERRVKQGKRGNLTRGYREKVRGWRGVKKISGRERWWIKRGPPVDHHLPHPFARLQFYQRVAPNS